jgi:hypothetical protein
MSQKKRSKSRVEISLLAASIHGNENEIIGKALNISLGGIAVKCSTFDRDQITPKGAYVCEGKPLEVSLVLNLPENKKIIMRLKQSVELFIRADWLRMSVS